jgi:NADH:ubiquinone oxidoreductase subunit E
LSTANQDQVLANPLSGISTLLDNVLPELSQLLPSLHKIQHELGYVPREAIPIIASKLHTTPAAIYGAITFYSEIRLEPPPQTEIAWCSGPACRLKGSENIKRALEAILDIRMGQKRADDRLGLRLVQCDGTCEQAPLLRLNGRTVGNLNVRSAIELGRGLLEGGPA